MPQSFIPSPELAQLLAFSEADADNVQLLGDAAARAYGEGGIDLADTLLARQAEIAPLPPALTNLWGLIALRQADHRRAGALFQSLIDAGADDPALSFNRAWCHALAGAHEDALGLLKEPVADALPQAATLRVETLHRLGRTEEAVAAGRVSAEIFPDHQPLAGAIANAALDDDDTDTATAFAARAGETGAGQSVTGFLLLAGHREDEAMAAFDAALAREPEYPRALLGRGLGLLARQDMRRATEAIDAAASGFATHLGSWVAAGWLQLINGDRDASRARFETARDLDENFAETHGGLAVLDILDGRIEEGRRRAEVALRLDRACFGAALAQSLIAGAEGKTEKAERIFQLALAQPAGPDSETIADALARIGLRG